jgi:hypothetical protein
MESNTRIRRKLVRRRTRKNLRRASKKAKRGEAKRGEAKRGEAKRGGEVIGKGTEAVVFYPGYVIEKRDATVTTDHKYVSKVFYGDKSEVGAVVDSELDAKDMLLSKITNAKDSFALPIGKFSITPLDI